MEIFKCMNKDYKCIKRRIFMKPHVFAGDPDSPGKISFQFEEGVLTVEKDKATFYPKDKNGDAVVGPKPKRWGEEAEAVKAAAVILAATFVPLKEGENWDKLRKELIKFLLKSHDDGIQTMRIHN
jgi:hypothetical protein